MPASREKSPTAHLKYLYHAIAILASLWTAVPLYLIAVSAFSTRESVYSWPKLFFPTEFSLDTISFFVNIQGVWDSTANSLITAFITMTLSMLAGAPAGYALARYGFVGKDFYRILILFTRAFPISILALPLTILFIRLGLYDNLLAVGIVHTTLALPFCVLITSSIFLSVPHDLEEAAWTLGASRLRAFFQVTLPLALPATVAAGIFAFIISWNEVFAASVLTLENRTLTAFLLSSLSESPLTFKLAGGFFLIIPAITFIFFSRKYLFSMWGIADR